MLEKRKIVVGGLTLITLGILLLLSNLGIYALAKSWPILLILVGVLAIFRNMKELSGWLISTAGVIFLITENDWININKISVYMLPLLIIVLGVLLIFRKRQKKSN